MGRWIVPLVLVILVLGRIVTWHVEVAEREPDHRGVARHRSSPSVRSSAAPLWFRDADAVLAGLTSIGSDDDGDDGATFDLAVVDVALGLAPLEATFPAQAHEARASMPAARDAQGGVEAWVAANSRGMFVPATFASGLASSGPAAPA